MADPLLTSLCTICRIQPPKYKCPRCSTRTCSLPCIKKHKKWSSCTGERDPTVYVPPSKLRTDAGIDHDYNFLTKIERSVEIAEKILRDEREILPQEGYNGPPPNKRARLHKGRSRGRVTLDENSRRWDRNSLQRMQRLGIQVASVPFGMSRSRENKSSWNKRTNTINWQVEWVVLGGVPGDVNSTGSNATLKKSRIMHKLLDQTPLYVGFANSLCYHRYQQLSEQQRAEEKKARKKQPASLGDEALERPGQPVAFAQNTDSTAWAAQPSPLQHHATAAWSRLDPLRTKADPAAEARKDEYRFFYQKPKRPLREAERLIPLEPTETLSTVLPGLEVVEFPTICVLPAGSPIPDEFVLEERLLPKETKMKTTPKKRKGSALVEYGSDEEGGDLDGDKDKDEDDDDDGDDDDGSEDGELLDQEPVDDDTTSSSGSDSDMDGC